MLLEVGVRPVVVVDQLILEKQIAKQRKKLCKHMFVNHWFHAYTVVPLVNSLKISQEEILFSIVEIWQNYFLLKPTQKTF